MGKSIRNLSTVTRVGLDLAKRVFQVHAVDAKGERLTPPISGRNRVSGVGDLLMADWMDYVRSRPLPTGNSALTHGDLPLLRGGDLVGGDDKISARFLGPV
jgi:hypothetical protein